MSHRKASLPQPAPFTRASVTPACFPPAFAMSTTLQAAEPPDGETFPCSGPDCDAEFTAATAVKGSFCSTACWHRDKGANVLGQIRGDHTLCATCFRQVKETYRPSEGELIDMGVKWAIREIFVGYQTRTIHATDAVDTSYRYKLDPDDPDPAETVPLVSNPLKFGRIGCICGDVDGRAEDATLRSVEGYATIGTNLFAALEELADRGAIHADPNARRFVDALDAHPGDWAHAVGAALYGQP